MSHANPTFDAHLRERHSAIEPRGAPKMTGKMYNETVGKRGFRRTRSSASIMVFRPMMIVGVQGMPRRYHDYFRFPRLEPMHQLITVGAPVALDNWVHGPVAGAKAPANPWGPRSLEWTTASPPPGNFPAAPALEKAWSPYGYGGQPLLHLRAWNDGPRRFCTLAPRSEGAKVSFHCLPELHRTRGMACC